MAGRLVRFSPETILILGACAEFSTDKAYLVGGALRDLLIDRAILDLDIACFAPRELAGALRRKFGGTVVSLDEQNGIYRLVFPDGRFKAIRQLDLSLIQGREIAEDLKRRDFTINAMALELSKNTPRELHVGRIIDPFDGRADLKQKIIRCKRKSILVEDPLRLLRAFRIAAQLGFSIEPRTLAMIAGLKKSVGKPSAERIKTEIVDIFSASAAGSWARLMDKTGILTGVFPGMEKTRKCARVYYGNGGVLAHSLATLDRMDFLLANLEAVFPRQFQRILGEIRKNEFGGGLGAFLRLVSFLHDIAKPDAAKMVDGRLRFFRHDEIGGKKISTLLRNLRFSRGWIDGAAAVVLHHLRPGNLAANRMISDRAAYRFFRNLGPNSLSLLLVCWADHASYIPEIKLRRHLGLLNELPGTFNNAVLDEEKKTIQHLQVVSLLMKRLFDDRKKAVPDPVIDGRDVMKILAIKPGPSVGKWLERVREAQASEKIKTRAEALTYLKNSGRRLSHVRG